MPITCKGAILREAGLPRPYADSAPLKIETVTLLDPAPTDVVVKVIGAGLCHSDLSVMDGNRTRGLPILLGHEGSGEVVEVGAGISDVAVGDRVEVDQPLVEVTTDKVDAEIPSPAAGVIEALLVSEGDTVEVGAELARIAEGGAAGLSAEAAESRTDAPATPATNGLSGEKGATESPGRELTKAPRQASKAATRSRSSEPAFRTAARRAQARSPSSRASVAARSSGRNASLLSGPSSRPRAGARPNERTRTQPRAAASGRRIAGPSLAT